MTKLIQKIVVRNSSAFSCIYMRILPGGSTVLVFARRKQVACRENQIAKMKKSVPAPNNKNVNRINGKFDQPCNQKFSRVREKTRKITWLCFNIDGIESNSVFVSRVFHRLEAIPCK